MVPIGATAREVSNSERAAIRARFDLPADALLVASFGILHMTKMNVEAIEAFAGVARAVPSALFAFVGHDLMGGQAREKAAELGLLDRVRFLGRQDDRAFADLIAATDLGVSLRLPPTNGETSAALMDLLGCGSPHDRHRRRDVSPSYPDAIVRKVRWDADGPSGLAAAMLGLATDDRAREALGRAASRHVARAALLGDRGGGLCRRHRGSSRRGPGAAGHARNRPVGRRGGRPHAGRHRHAGGPVAGEPGPGHRPPRPQPRRAPAAARPRRRVRPL